MSRFYPLTAHLRPLAHELARAHAPSTRGTVAGERIKLPPPPLLLLLCFFFTFVCFMWEKVRERERKGGNEGGREIQGGREIEEEGGR